MMHMAPAQAPQLSETTFFSEREIFVSNARIVVKSTTYPLGHVTSVTPFTIPPKRAWPIVCVVLGTMMTLGALSSKAYAVIALGLPMLLGGVLVLVIRKAKHAVYITTSAGRVELLATDDIQFAQRLSAALSQAMIARG
jgi:Family of unknown function (DUF6232)